MAKAKKLPSGQWRALVYDYTDANGKRHYESFTADTKKESEYMAADFSLNKKRRSKPINLTVRESIDEYIKNSDAVLSPTTIQGYNKIKRNSYQEIMEIPLKNLSQEILQNAINSESKRPSKRNGCNYKTVSPKTVKNSWGLIAAVINRYYPSLDYSIKLPAAENVIKELPPPEVIMNVVKDTEIELPVLLAMWLSFSMSEIRGLKRSSINNGYISIKEVVVDVNCEAVHKKQAKAFTRIRKHEIPDYIQQLINKTNVGSDELISLSGHAIYMRFKRLLEKNGLPHMTFHDLRHVNASVMAMLRIPDKYAMERGGWKTDKVMKKVYTHTFSEEREKVDTIIDNYFETTLGIKKQKIDINKYHAWLTLCGKTDSNDSKSEFIDFMQHEMQHIKKEP
ncbi:prophage LambdaBa04, site-specific recombinase, phage integrase family [Lachnospiraceae bacterium KM106-2]|nr:prophage LambdaBa04, site-specific recombinase, phage integrase family [Lachnospiraceae bacterium KM106-2]